MSDSPSSNAGSPGFERRWQTADKTSYKSLDKQSRLILLSLGVVVVGGLIVGSFLWLGSAKVPKLCCLPVSEYGAQWPSPFWFYNDANGLLETIRGKEHNFSTTQQKDKLLLEFDLLAKQKETTFIIYLAGLGAWRKDQVYLLPANADLDNRDTWISMEDIFRKIEALDCEHVLLLLDLATPLTNLYQGPLTNNVAEALDQWLTSNIKSDHRLLVLTSCSAGEISQPMAAQGKTAFGYYLQKGFQGSAKGFDPQGKNGTYLRARELAAYMKSSVNGWSMHNRRAPQNPKLYGQGDFDLVHVDHVIQAPIASKNETPVSDAKESKEEEEKRIKKENEAENELVTSMFPEELLKNWQQRNDVILPLISRMPETFQGRLNDPEHELKLAVMRKLERTLHFYENTSLMIKNTQYSKLITIIRSASLKDGESDKQKYNKLAQKLLDSQPRNETNSLSALFPRVPPREDEALKQVYDTVFSDLKATSNIGYTKVNDSKEELLIAAIKENKKTTETEKIQPSRHQEMLYLCWKKLCDEEKPTLEKCIRTQQVMKAIINHWREQNKEVQITKECLELRLLVYLITKQYKEWDFYTPEKINPTVDGQMSAALGAWLQLEFIAMQVETAFLPNGLGFGRHREELEAVIKKHLELAEEIKEAKVSNNFKSLPPRIQVLTNQYKDIMKTVDVEHRLHSTWWKCLATSLVTAELMVTSDSKVFGDWNKLVEASIKLANCIETNKYDQETGDSIQTAEAARKQLLKHFDGYPDILIKPANAQLANALDCIALERLLQGGILTAPDRKKVYGQLIKLHRILHESTVEFQANNTPPPKLGPSAVERSQDHAARRCTVSLALLQLAGMKEMKPNGDFEKDAKALREAWKEATKQLEKLRGQEAWFMAARMEAVLPDAASVDAILEWRKKESEPYLEWLKQRLDDCMACWK